MPPFLTVPGIFPGDLAKVLENQELSPRGIKLGPDQVRRPDQAPSGGLVRSLRFPGGLAECRGLDQVLGLGRLEIDEIYCEHRCSISLDATYL